MGVDLFVRGEPFWVPLFATAEATATANAKNAEVSAKVAALRYGWQTEKASGSQCAAELGEGFNDAG